MTIRMARFVPLNSCTLEVIVYDKGTEGMYHQQVNTRNGRFTSESTVKHGKYVTVVSRVYGDIPHSESDEQTLEKNNNFDSAFLDWVAQGGEV